MTWTYSPLLLALHLGLLAIGGDSPKPEHGTPEYQVWQTEGHITYLVRTADTTKLMLLDRKILSNYEDWRDHFDQQFMGFPVRSDVLELEADDIELLQSLLLEPSYYTQEMKWCGTKGDAALVLQGPHGELEIMLELWCARIHFRGTYGCRLSYDVDAMQVELLELAVKYFPHDEYLQDQLARLNKNLGTPH